MSTDGSGIYLSNHVSDQRNINIPFTNHISNYSNKDLSLANHIPNHSRHDLPLANHIPNHSCHDLPLANHISNNSDYDPTLTNYISNNSNNNLQLTNHISYHSNNDLPQSNSNKYIPSSNTPIPNQIPLSGWQELHNLGEVSQIWGVRRRREDRRINEGAGRFNGRDIGRGAREGAGRGARRGYISISIDAPTSEMLPHERSCHSWLFRTERTSDVYHGTRKCTRIHMESRRFAFLLMGILLVSASIIGLTGALVLSRAAPKYIVDECPADYGFNPILIVSLDGFRADYLERGLTPHIQALADAGVTAPYMKASYPTVTFPNHYTIVTGSYPETHGIIANKFYDPEFNKMFSLSSEESKNGRWWGAQPIWNTVNEQGKKSATFFWPGSDADINGTHPTYWYLFDGAVPFEDRVDQVLEWVAMDESERPSFISLYFDEPDHTGHGEGPDSSEVNDQLVHVDSQIQRLTEGLMDQGHSGCVNLIIIADHGMAYSGEGKVFKTAEYIANVSDLAYTSTGAFGRINPKDKDPEVKFGMLENLVCQDPKMRAYEKEGLPTRFHFSNNRRIEDIVMDLDPGYTLSVTSDWFLNGQHGYDNYFSLMNALFLAAGPAFQEGIEVEPFQNIELYNVMCHLAGVVPAPNNGSLGSLDHILKNPPPRDPLPEESKPPTAVFPSEEELPNRLGISGCPGDLQAPEAWVYSLDVPEDIQSELEQLHLPWGIPHSGDLPADLSLLHQDDYVTGYSSSLHMPLWTSFTVKGSSQEVPVSEWCSDPRLTDENTPTCAAYDALKNVSMGPLFPPGYSTDASLERVPYVVSNAIPMTSQLSAKWQELLVTRLNSWVQNYGVVNVIVGPVFDNDADSHPDDFTDFGAPPEVPSDLFVVMTRCKTSSSSLDLCDPTDLDAQAFIYPLVQRVPNCLEPDQYMLMFSAKVHDVELATGLDLYPNLEVHDRLRLLLRVHDSLWN